MAGGGGGGSRVEVGIEGLYNNNCVILQPSWTMYIQIMTFKEAENFRWNPFDLTKVMHTAMFTALSSLYPPMR